MKIEYLETYYSQDWVFKEIKEHFNIGELVSPEVIRKYGVDTSWSFLDFRLLSNLLYIRRARGYGITINYDDKHQRGLRENTSEIVTDATDDGKIYLSGHVLGMAVDFHETHGDIAENIRTWCVANADDLPYKCRFEHKKNDLPISWVHMDMAFFLNYNKVYLFDA